MHLMMAQELRPERYTILKEIKMTATKSIESLSKKYKM